MAVSSEMSADQQSGGYQRILVPDKLKKIREFVKNDPKVAFPTNLTLVLNSECEKRDSKLHIPSKYASIDVIDGHVYFPMPYLVNRLVKKPALSQLRLNLTRMMTRK